MTQIEQLHELLDKKSEFCSLSKIDQVKYMAFFYIKITSAARFMPKDINYFFECAGVGKPSNIHEYFSQLVDRKEFLSSKEGYYIHRNILTDMEKEFCFDKPSVKVSNELRGLLDQIPSSNKRQFLEEAITCFEVHAYRASIIMTWLLTVSSLQEYVFSKRLADFNNALQKQNLRIKEIKSLDSFTELEESKFIEICRSAEIITKDVRKILDEKLGIRNSCAHPSSITISESKATSFIEDLINNVYLKYVV